MTPKRLTAIWWAVAVGFLCLAVAGPPATRPTDAAGPVAPAPAPPALVPPAAVAEGEERLARKAAPPNLPRGYALVVGVNDYPGTGNDLAYCVPDANSVAALLRASGYAPGDVVALSNAQATEAGIAAQVAQLAAQMDGNDAFFFYYSGHGDYAATATAPGACNVHTPHPYPNNYYNYWAISHPGAIAIRVRFDNFNVEAGYDIGFVADPYFYGYAYTGNKGTFWSAWVMGDTALVGIDADYVYNYYGFDVTAYEVVTAANASLVTYDFGTGGGLWGHELNACLAAIPDGVQQFVVLDSCMSGGVIPPAARANRSIMAACKVSEYSLESPSLGHGVFTYYFLDAHARVNGTARADADKDGNVTFAEAYAYASPKATSYAAGLDSSQHPQLDDQASPVCFDADGDGLFNWEETDVHGSDPLATDSDGDGILDGVEVHTYRTSPASSDTDKDGLPDPAEIFVHGTDPCKADSDADGLDDYLELFAHGTDPWDNDTDADGLLDGAEVFTHHTNATCTDTDADLLNDGDEVLRYKTNATNPDTDGDGLLDGAEILTYRTSALKWDSDGDGISDGAEVLQYHSDPRNFWSPFNGPILGFSLLMAGVLVAVGSYKYRKAHPRPLRQAAEVDYYPTYRVPTPAPAPTYTPTLAPTYLGYTAAQWEGIGIACLRRGMADKAVEAHYIAAELRAAARRGPPPAYLEPVEPVVVAEASAPALPGVQDDLEAGTQSSPRVLRPGQCPACGHQNHIFADACELCRTAL